MESRKFEPDRNYRKLKNHAVIFVLMLVLLACRQGDGGGVLEDDDPDTGGNQKTFPSFITPVESYFEFSIAEVPAINAQSYQLTITGEIDQPTTLSLDDLRSLSMIDKTLTIECIHNHENGPLIGTAVWKGFSLIDLLDSLGLTESAKVVKYGCADGYFTAHTIEEVRELGVLGALYMNLEPIPAKYGFPLRFVIPGFYGVKNPGWVTTIEILDEEIPDYWNANGWQTDAPIGVDCKVFFPADEETVALGDTVKIGGAAYGGARMEKVEYSADGGNTWAEASIIREQDEDYVWVFWKVDYVTSKKGRATIRFRATNRAGDVQPEEDNNFRDGTNSRPKIYINVL
jgi:DMSO/TMAO reductase YedYZ molybdopterin-dependent catalytic subunit